MKGAITGKSFKTSATYWEDRYRSGGTSGCGSYRRLAEFKARVLNDFVAENDIRSIIEFGSGDGAQLELARYPAYIGVDISTAAIEMTRKKFDGDSTKRFFHASEVPEGTQAELGLSLDVVYHLVEDEVFDAYMKQLFDAAQRYVIVYASNEDKPQVVPHVRHRAFTRWVESNRPDFALARTIPNQYPYDPSDPENTSFADFYVFEYSGGKVAN